MLYPLVILTIIAICMAGLEATVALWTERQLQWGVREVSIFFLYIGLVMVVVQGGFVRPLAKRIGEGKLVLAGTILQSVGFAAVLVVYSAPMAFVGGTLIAAGFALSTPSLTALISRNAPDEHQGAAMGASQSAQAFSRILGPLAFGIAFDGLGRDVPYLGGAALLFIGFLIAIKAMKYAKRDQSG